MNLDGKVSLITGGARLGQTVALALAERGSDIALTYYRSRRAVRDTAQAIEDLGRRALAIHADLSAPAGPKNVVSQVRKHFRRLDVFIHMASIYEGIPFKRLSARAWDRNIDVNLKSAYEFALNVALLMRNRRGGRIVFVSDWTAASGRPRYRDYVPYYVSKAGLEGLTQVLALELAPDVLVNSIAPGPILPPPGLSRNEYNKVIRATPLRKWGGSEEVAKAVLFLIETDFVTGECIRVDGGRHLY